MIYKIINLRDWLLIKSIRAAAKEQGLSSLMDQLSVFVPDITYQYTTFDLDSNYLKKNLRALHAFQIYLVERALNIFGKDNFTIVDIGDSSGTHICYLKEIYKYYKFRFLSVNLDKAAVDKIKSKRLEAMHCRAEDLSNYSINADIFLSFEMLEHLRDPIKFLKDISGKTTCKGLILTAPYLASSRIGLHHIRNGDKRNVNPENTHIFELSPSDWRLIFMHSGWSIVSDKIYLQYPTRGLLRLMKGYWKKNDFEGYYGAILSRDCSWSQLYDGW